MDTPDYLPMFLAESRESLQELNLAVVRLEERPDDREVLDEIFRLAHSLKGMSATMGFAQIAALTHKREDVRELLRRRSTLPSEIVDVLLACLDALDDALTQVERDGTEGIEAEPLIERLRSVVREDDTRVRAARDLPDAVPLVPARPARHRAVHVRATLSDDAAMPSVRAFQVLAALAAHGEILASTPAQDAIEGFAGHAVEAIIDTAQADAPVVAALLAVSEVASADVASAGPAAPADSADELGKRVAPTVRIDAERLDQLMHFMGELVAHRTRVEALAGDAAVPGLRAALEDMARSAHALEDLVMQVRMIPVAAVFLRFPRVVRDLSTTLGKDVTLRLVGKETELDRTVVEKLGDPIVHLIRNALDHGFESPSEREAAGKPPAGTLELAARPAGRNVVISVTDDGRGIDPRLVAERAAERGLIPASDVDAVDVDRAIELLFTPGFTTAEATSDLSGRGVGMDAVRMRIRELGGEVVMRSEPGKGTEAEIRLPLTLAISDVLIVDAGARRLAIALDRVERTVSLDRAMVRSIAAGRVLVLRDGVVPLLDLAPVLGLLDGAEDGAPADRHAVLVRAGDRRFALAVTALGGQHELVTRPLPPEAASSVASAVAVLPDGTTALLLDCEGLADAGPAQRLAATPLQEA